MTDHVLIIAEVGINHNGDPELAKEIILAAKQSGADIAKIHTYSAEEVMISATPLAEYMKEDGEDRDGFLAMARSFELTNTDTESLQQYCNTIGINFLSSPFDVPSVDYLSSLGVDRLKLPSGELVNPFLLQAAAKTGLPLIVSTGMASLEEVTWAMDFLREHNAGPVSILHCLSQYPAEFQYVNLKALETLRKAFPGIPVGFSDHTPGIEASIAAVGLGAEIIEKHLTLDRSLPGPDQAASLIPEEFTAMVRAIRNIEQALGDGTKEPAPPELDNQKIVRKSLVLTTDCDAGTVLTRKLLAAKRPGTGIPARELNQVIGKQLSTSVAADEILDWSMFA